MDIKISIKTKAIISDSEYQSYKKSNMELRIYGKTPLMVKDKPFEAALLENIDFNVLDDIVPYMAGECFYILLQGSTVIECAADYYCHERVYYTLFDDILNISDDWRKLPHKNMKWNIFELLYFLNWDSTVGGQTYFEELNYFCPTYKYIIDSAGKIKASIMTFKSLWNFRFHEAMAEVLKTVSREGKKIGIMLSGGMDSSEIAYTMQEIGADAKYYCSRIMDFDMFDNMQDCLGAGVLAEELNLDFKYVDVDLTKFLEYWNGELEKHVAFAYKDGRFWQSVVRAGKEDGLNLIINGNHADYLYEFGYTADEHAGERADGIEYFKTMRQVTTNANLEKVFRDNNPSRAVIDAWNRFNDVDFNPSRFLAWIMTNGNCYPGYNGLVVNECCLENAKTQYDSDLQSLLTGLIDAYKEGEFVNARHLVLESTMIGNIDGENARAIMGACKSNDIECFIMHASPMIYNASINMVFSEENIDMPKKETQEFLKQKAEYVKADRVKRELKKNDLMTAGDIWEVILEQLNSVFDVDGCRKQMLEMCYNMELFDKKNLEKLLSKDIGVKLRMAWLGHIYEIYKKSME